MGGSGVEFKGQHGVHAGQIRSTLATAGRDESFCHWNEESPFPCGGFDGATRDQIPVREEPGQVQDEFNDPALREDGTTLLDRNGIPYGWEKSCLLTQVPPRRRHPIGSRSLLKNTTGKGH